MSNEKCLVMEAMDKCKCDMCKIHRDMRDLSIRCIVQDKFREIIAKQVNQELPKREE